MKKIKLFLLLEPNAEIDFNAFKTFGLTFGFDAHQVIQIFYIAAHNGKCIITEIDGTDEDVKRLTVVCGYLKQAFNINVKLTVIHEPVNF